MLNFLILGPLRVQAGKEQVALGPLRRQALLGVLLCRANQVVPVATLAEALWDGSPPRTAPKNLQMQLSILRKLLASSGDAPPAAEVRLVNTPPGYTLFVGPEQLDALRFTDLAHAGRRALRAGQGAIACDLLGQAVRLWRGPVLADLAGIGPIDAEAESLRELYLSAYEDLAEVRLALGRHGELIEGLDELTRRHPFRERLRYAHMLALYRSGRQAEALAQYDEARQVLARELGIQPSPVLARLYESILTGDQSIGSSTSRPAPVAMRSVEADRTGLVRDIPDFTGRARELDTLMRVLDDKDAATVVTITGPVGVGKTALAVHCAHQLGRAYPHGRVLASLRAANGQPRPVPEILRDLLRALRAASPPGAGLADLAALLRDATASRRMLFVLDDAGSEAQVRDVLAALGADDGTSVIVTSRRHLGGLEAAWRLTADPLPQEEAWTFLSRLVGAERLAAEPGAAWCLIGTCGGLPLLIRAAGARLSGLRHLSLARFAARLADSGCALDHLEAGTLRIRSRFRSALRDLSACDQSTLRALARLADGPFTARQAGSQLGAQEAVAELAIERLLEAHVVSVHMAEVLAHAGSETSYVLSWPVRVLMRDEQPL